MTHNKSILAHFVDRHFHTLLTLANECFPDYHITMISCNIVFRHCLLSTPNSRHTLGLISHNAPNVLEKIFGAKLANLGITSIWLTPLFNGHYFEVSMLSAVVAIHLACLKPHLRQWLQNFVAESQFRYVLRMSFIFEIIIYLWLGLHEFNSILKQLFLGISLIDCCTQIQSPEVSIQKAVLKKFQHFFLCIHQQCQ